MCSCALMSKQLIIFPPTDVTCRRLDPFSIWGILAKNCQKQAENNKNRSNLLNFRGYSPYLTSLDICLWFQGTKSDNLFFKKKRYVWQGQGICVSEKAILNKIAFKNIWKSSIRMCFENFWPPLYNRL